MNRQKILIVQDDSLLAEGLRIVIDGRRLRRGRHGAGTPPARIKLAAQHRPALAIVDMMLELDVDGIATATSLKQKHGLEILITTGFPDSVMEREGVDDFACAVVRKPYTDEDILQAVKRCLNGTHAQPS